MDTLSGEFSPASEHGTDEAASDGVGPRSFNHPYVLTAPVTRGPTLSEQQAVHHRRAIKILESHPFTGDIALKIARCRLARSAPRSGRTDIVRFRCRLMHCPYCQGEWRPRKGQAADIAFAHFPDDRVHFVTVLLDDLAPLPPGIRPQDAGLRAPIVRARAKLDAALAALRSEAYVAAGGLEFEEIEYPVWGNKGAFLRSLHGAVLPTDRTSSLVLHAHFFLTARREGVLMDATALRDTWESEFPHRYQVRVQTQKPADKSEPIRSGVHYALKAFTDISPDRLAQVALTAEASGRRLMAFSRRRKATLLNDAHL